MAIDGGLMLGDWAIVHKSPDYTGETDEWIAYDPDDSDVEVCVSGDALCVSDGCQYYPSGGYSVPFAVIDKLRELQR